MWMWFTGSSAAFSVPRSTVTCSSPVASSPSSGTSSSTQFAVFRSVTAGGPMPEAMSPVGSHLPKKMGGNHHRHAAAVTSTFVSRKVAAVTACEFTGVQKKGRLPPKRGLVKARIVWSLVRSVVTMMSKGDGRDRDRRTGEGGTAPPSPVRLPK